MLQSNSGEPCVVLESVGGMVSVADCAFQYAICWIIVHTPSIENIAYKLGRRVSVALRGSGYQQVEPVYLQLGVVLE